MLSVLLLLVGAARASPNGEGGGKVAVRGPLRKPLGLDTGEHNFQQVEDSNLNCAQLLYRVVYANRDNPWCQLVTSLDGDEPDKKDMVNPERLLSWDYNKEAAAKALPSTDIVRSYEADYWYPSPEWFKYYLPREKMPKYTAKHKCHVYRGWMGCSQELLQTGLSPQWYMLCPGVAWQPAPRPFEETPFIELIGSPPDQAICRKKADDKEKFWRAMEMVQKRRSAQAGASTERDLSGTNLICLDHPAGSKSAKFWHYDPGSEL